MKIVKQLIIYDKYVKSCLKKGKKPLPKTDWKTKVFLVGGTGSLVAGASQKSKITGLHKFYHGQSRDDIVDKIEKEGILKKYGGTGVSQNDNKFKANDPNYNHGLNVDYVKESKGNIHVSKKKSTGNHYSMNSKYWKLRKNASRKFYNKSKEEIEEAIKLNHEYGMSSVYDNGKTFKVNLSYDQMKALKKDEKAPNKQKAFLGPIDIDRRAIINNSQVSKEDKKNYKKEMMKDYRKNHKVRFGVGVGAAALGAGVAAGLGYKIYKINKKRKQAYEEYKKQGGKESFDKWKNEIYKETIDFINDYEYFIEELSENELNYLIEVLDKNII